MKYKYIASTILAIVLLSGCATTPRKITTVTKPIGVPILYCPAPPILIKPALPISNASSNTSDGELVKLYVATIETLVGYINEQQSIIIQYGKDNAAYATLAALTAKQWKAKTGETLDLSQIPGYTTQSTAAKAKVKTTSTPK